MGSLYLQKNTFISCCSSVRRFCTMRLMLRSATYWISGSLDSSVTRGGAIFRWMLFSTSWLWMSGMNFIRTFTAPRTTAELACCRRGVTRSQMFSASRASRGLCFAMELRMKTWPHSVHSFRAARSLETVADVISKTSSAEPSEISDRAATALATTMGLESDRRSLSVSRKPWSRTSSALMSYSLATHTAAVLRTYGSGSLRLLCRGWHRYSVILFTRMHPMVRTASARMSGLGLDASLTNVFTARMARSGWLLA
mmetsp:Transcript_37360/g.93847  ORF Transcript_37360/g.93847 Transcript_37360/m.93847 type:complete len:255 (-) Transcript_37360:404-1168(-)